MPFPNQDYSKRGYELPAGCKDLAEAIKQERASTVPPMPLPPITRRITLPEIVSVRYLAEVSGKDINHILRVMSRLRILASVDRSISFDDAVRILRRYGIGADKAA
jgi:hypothetical protein